ncbi:MAG: aminotransferase class I/II-fold pyridoxal phosphate-dependent enzyme [Treponema sp.]|uniref:pyridoxal phosphate-dependent aminotransferase n=1 Tax=Treponema sp. TaxID=166 RepID=UPI0025FF6235|nr:histidinol-phosphate transaminase [Treponema sp.]MBQ9282158.1 aminotransferase class I/II-fold pyridoxal phosphate-dependent enzyme [Treponema sp.]
MLASRMNNLHPYVPGEQPKDRVYIKLNANENPYPPSPLVIKAVRNAAKKHPEKLALYPDPDSNSLKEAISDMLNKTGGVLCRANLEGGKKNGSKARVSPSEADKIPFVVSPEMIYVGNGSDEVLSFVFYAFFDSDRKLVLPEHTYSFYPVYGGFYDIPLEKIPLNSDWTLNKEKMIEAANNENSGIIFANPNAPTSLGLTRDEVREMLKKAPKDKVFVVDEAYVDFGGESSIPLLAEFQNLVIVRTTSKSLCGAGQRLGYLVANKELVNAVTTVKNSLNHFPIDFLAQQAGIAACKDVGYYVHAAQSVAFERDEFIDFLREKGWSVLDSQTNFIFCKKDGVDGKAAYKKIKEEGILIRRFDTPGIEEYLRITVGTHEQMQALRDVMEEI